MKIAVIGAGVMGSGIAQVAAQCDKVKEVVLCDVNLSLAQTGQERIKKALNRLVAKERMKEEEQNRILGKMIPGLTDSAYDADLVIEAVIENMDIKKKLFAELDANCKEECIFASNTSSLSITEMGNGLSMRGGFLWAPEFQNSFNFSRLDT